MTLPAHATPAAPLPAPSPARVLAAVRNVLDTAHIPQRELRDWLWTHTSQPNGQPWNDDREALDAATCDLADLLRGA